MDKKQILKEAREASAAGRYKEAFQKLAAAAETCDDFAQQSRYALLSRKIPTGSLDLKKVRIAVLASSTAGHLVDVLRFWLRRGGFEAEVFESGYNTIQQTILDPQNKLYEYRPDIVVIMMNYRDVSMEIPAGASWQKVEEIVVASTKGIKVLWDALRKRSDAYIIQSNLDVPLARPMGNFEGAVVWSRENAFHFFNLKLADLAQAQDALTIFDIDHIASLYGKEEWYDRRYWYHSKHAFSLDATGLVAARLANLILAVKGQSKKCLVLDLDNTLWGGIIADDGLENLRLGNGPDGEAFVDFQKYLLDLKRRGVILAVCSKNEENLAKEPFLKHPDMQIRLDDIAVFCANWADKAANIREIARRLNIGLDSMVFVDDDPVEGALVRQILPMVSVPEMPADPAGYVDCLDRQDYFAMVSFSEEDRGRSKMYRQNALREDYKCKFSEIDDFLKGLRMEMVVGQFDALNMSRIAQLINKSNQFHLTTTRYSESQIQALLAQGGYYGIYFRLKDRLGDNGLISAVLLERRGGALVVDTWVMSCRVLSRGAEEFILNELISFSRETGVTKLIGKYIPTKKNKLVENLYARLGFQKTGEENDAVFWELAIDETVNLRPTFIKKVKSF